MPQISLGQEAQKTQINLDVFLHKNEPAPFEGFLSNRQNYQFYQRRVDLSYIQQNQINNIDGTLVKIDTSIVDISLGIVIGAIITCVFTCH